VFVAAIGRDFAEQGAGDGLLEERAAHRHLDGRELSTCRRLTGLPVLGGEHVVDDGLRIADAGGRRALAVGIAFAGERFYPFRQLAAPSLARLVDGGSHSATSSCQTTSQRFGSKTVLSRWIIGARGPVLRDFTK